MPLKEAEANAYLDDVISRVAAVRLYTVAPTATTDGTVVTGGSYDHAATDSSDWDAAAAGEAASRAEIAFPTSSAAWSSGASIVAFALVDSGGSQLLFEDLAAPIVVGSAGITPSFAAGDLVVRAR